jgi:hypothetical protein
VGETSVDLEHKVVVLDRSISKILWDFQKSETVAGRWSVVISPMFKEWAGSLRGNYRLRRIEVSPYSVQNGEAEYKALCMRFKNMMERYGWLGDRDAPLGVKRWQISFSDVRDAVMFKMRWIG